MSLYTGCFGQHVLVSLYGSKATAEVNKLFTTVQGKIAGADGLSQKEEDLAVQINLSGWNSEGKVTADDVRAFLKEGAALSDEAAAENIKKVASLLGLTSIYPVVASTITFALAVASADGLATEESEKAKTIAHLAGVTDEQYKTITDAWDAEVKAYELAAKIYNV